MTEILQKKKKNAGDTRVHQHSPVIAHRINSIDFQKSRVRHSYHQLHKKKVSKLFYTSKR